MTDIASIAQTLLSGFFDIDGRSAIERTVASDVCISGVEGLDIHGKTEFLRFHNMLWCQFDVLAAEPAIVLADAPWVSIIGVLTLRERGTGVQAQDRFQVTMRIDHGLVSEVIVFVDFLAVFESIGRLPPRTLDRCLAGEAMRAI